MAREYVKDLDSVRDVAGELKDIFGNFGDELDNISVAEMKILKNAEKVVKEFSKSSKYNKENRDYAEYISNKLKEDIINIRDANGLRVEATEETQKQVGMYDKITTKLKEEKNIIRGGILGGLQEIDGVIGGLGAKIINNLTSPMGMLLVAVGAILSVFMKWNDALQEIHDSFGAFVKVGDQLYNITKQQRLELIQTGANMQELLQSADSLSKAMGLTLEESVKLSGEAYKTHRELGIEVETVERLFELQQEILGISQDELRTHTKMIGVFARQAGVAPKAVLEDIAGSSEIFAKYQGEGAESMVRAATAAKRMGVDLSAIDQMAESIMNYESSIAAEFEFQAIWGKKIDLTNARRLIATNQMDKAFTSITDQLGTQVDLENMGYYQRQSLSKLLGMDLAQITAITNAQKEGRDASKAMATDLQEGKEAADAMSFKDVVTPLTALQNTLSNMHILFETEFSDIFEGMSGSIKTLTEVFTKEDSPIRRFFVDMGKMFTKVFADVAKHEEGLGGYLKENLGNAALQTAKDHPWLATLLGGAGAMWVTKKLKPLWTAGKWIKKSLGFGKAVSKVDDVAEVAKTVKTTGMMGETINTATKGPGAFSRMKKLLGLGGGGIAVNELVDIGVNNKKVQQKAANAIVETVTEKAFAKAASKTSVKFIPLIGSLFNLASAAYYGIGHGRWDIAGMEMAGATSDVASIAGAAPSFGASLPLLQAASMAADVSAAYMIYKHEIDMANQENKNILDESSKRVNRKNTVKVTRNDIQFITAD